MSREEEKASIPGTSSHTPESRVPPTVLYIAGLCLAAVTSLALWIFTVGASFSVAALSTCAGLAALNTLLRRYPVRFVRSATDVADVAVLVALVLFGPLWAIAVEAPSAIFRDRLRTTFVLSGDTIKILAAGAIFSIFSPPLLSGGSIGVPLLGGPLLGVPLSGGLLSGVLLVAGIVAAAVVFYALDALTNAGLVRLKYATPVLQVLRESFLPLVAADAAAVGAVVVTAFGVSFVGPAAAVVTPVGAAVALSLVGAAREKAARLAALETENARLREDVRGLRGGELALAARLVENLAERDGRTPRLSAAAAVYAADVAVETGFSPERLSELRIAALLMDTGLAGLPDEVLLTPPEKLNSVGKRLLEEHPERGERLLRASPAHAEAALWVRWHHERPDGTGYPDRLKGEWIPLEAKILAAARMWATLILDSPYRSAHPTDEARRLFVAELGPGVDGEVGRVLLRVLESKDEAYRRASDERFTFSLGEDLGRESGGGPAENAGSGGDLRAV